MTSAAVEQDFTLPHLDALESETVHIFREVAGEFERPVILFSGGKDSIVMPHLALKAFAPGEHVRVFPLSNWTEPDVWQYIAREGIELPEIYFAHRREVFRRGGIDDGKSTLVGRLLHDSLVERSAHMDWYEGPALLEFLEFLETVPRDRRHRRARQGRRPRVRAAVTSDLGRITLRTAEPLALDEYADVRRTGAFLLVDPADGSTLTAGMADLSR